MAPALVYALWTEDRHDQGTPQLRGLYATLEAAQARAAADSTLPLGPWRPAVGYVDNASHLGQPALQAETLAGVGDGAPLCTWTIEPTRVQG